MVTSKIPVAKESQAREGDYQPMSIYIASISIIGQVNHNVWPHGVVINV